MRQTGGTRLWGAISFAVLAGCETTVMDPELAARVEFSGWTPAASIEGAAPGAHQNFNTGSLDGCPFIAPDGKRFYMASNRPDGLGGIDIWVSTRSGPSEPWGAPVNVGAPVNSDVDDFCPTLARDGHTFYFVSRRQVGDFGVDWCGGADIYVTRRRVDHGFEEPRNLGCEVNSPADEFSPFPVENEGGGPGLYYSSTRAGLGTGGDLYFSPWKGNGFGAGVLVPGVNSTSDDGQPNVSQEGLELYFYSNRTEAGALGGNDIYVASRASLHDPWSTPINLGPNVNSAQAETRPSLSRDGTTLYFGSTRAGEGSSDIYVTTRGRMTGVVQ